MSEPAPSPSRTRALIALAVVQVLFGANPVLGKLAIPAFGPGGVVLVRVAGAAVAFGIARVALRLPAVRGPDLPRLIACSAAGIVVNQLLFMNGLARTSAAHAALLTTTIPAITLAIAIAMGLERATPRRVVGLLVAGAGAALLILARSAGGAGGATLLGDGLIVANATVYSFYLVISRPLLARHHAVSVLSGVFGWGLVLTLPYTGIPVAAFTAPGIPSAAWASLAFLVLGPTVGAYGLNLYALRVVPSSTVALWIYGQPVVAAALAVPLLGEQVTLVMLASGLLTFLGMAIGG